MFNEVKKKLGFGCMRLPGTEEKIDYDELNKMVDKFLEEGFNYFDTSILYYDGGSEIALKHCLVERHKREEFLIADKLTGNYFETEEDLEPLFQRQANNLGIEYFDFFLLHAMNHERYDKFKRVHAFEFYAKKKEEGKIRHFGMSFHDTAEVLDDILTKEPSIEFVQLQFNYVDYISPVESKKCYDVCVKHGKPVIVMEPVRGGKLAKLPDYLHEELKQFGDASDASYAIRFAATHENIFMVLSGMSNYEQMCDNVSYMKDFKPLSKEEFDEILHIADELHKVVTIPCTGCRYCTKGCPMKINIPEYFKIYNDHKSFNGRSLYKVYNELKSKGSSCKDCIKCGKCEDICPQKIDIRHQLEIIANEFGDK